jgi:CRP-like cAMP-binding protein
VVLDVEVDVVVGTRPGQSSYFEALERDALEFGAKPVELQLPDDLAPVRRRVAEDVAQVLGVYEVIDGAGTPVPYSQRFGAERLGLNYRMVGRALADLVRLGVLSDCGETEPHRHYPRGTRLYQPGGAAR